MSNRIVMLSPAEFARELSLSGIDVTVRCVQLWCKKKTLRSALRVGKRWHIDPREVDRLLKKA